MGWAGTQPNAAHELVADIGGADATAGERFDSAVRTWSDRGGLGAEKSRGKSGDLPTATNGRRFFVVGPPSLGTDEKRRGRGAHPAGKAISAGVEEDPVRGTFFFENAREVGGSGHFRPVGTPALL